MGGGYGVSLGSTLRSSTLRGRDLGGWALLQVKVVSPAKEGSIHCVGDARAEVQVNADLWEKQAHQLSYHRGV